MPIVNIDLAWMNRLLGREFPPEELEDALDQIGCDVEDLVEITRYHCPRCHATVEGSLGVNEVKVCPFCGHQAESAFEEVGQVSVVRLDLLAARPDLFDVGGLARALRGFLDLATGLPDYVVEPGGLQVTVAPEMDHEESFRPFIHCAVMTLPPVDDQSLVAIMKLQESLHWGIGRDRKLASIGIYDLDTLEGDIHYRSLHPDDEPFIPLGMPDTEMTGRQILTEHPKGKAYAHLIEHLERYPVLLDHKGQVLSMPPIINSEKTKLKLGTRRVFIDVTGISDAAVRRTLDTLVCSLAELGGKPESVQVNGLKGSFNSPNLTPRETEVDLDAAREWLGIAFDEATLVRSLERMRFDVEPLGDGRSMVRYPAFRTDIRHMVDLFEDLAIGYGYRNFEPKLVSTMTVGQARTEEDVSAIARQTLLGLGFSEVMSLPLCTEEDHFTKFRLEVPASYPRVANPKLRDLKVVRTHLLTGILQLLRENRRRPLPLRLFELDNVVLPDDSGQTRTREERRVAFAVMAGDAGYAAARSTMDSLLREYGVTGTYLAKDRPSFLSGRCAVLETDKGMNGRLGELHPEVITAFGLDHPVVIGEVALCSIDSSS